MSEERTIIESYKNTTSGEVALATATHEDGAELYQDSIADEVPITKRSSSQSKSKEVPVKKSKKSSRNSETAVDTKSSKKSLNQRLCEAPLEPADINPRQKFIKNKITVED